MLDDILTFVTTHNFFIIREFKVKDVWGGSFSF